MLATSVHSKWSEIIPICGIIVVKRKITAKSAVIFQSWWTRGGSNSRTFRMRPNALPWCSVFAHGITYGHMIGSYASNTYCGFSKRCGVIRFCGWRCFLSLFVRMKILAVVAGLVIILNGKLRATVQAAQAHGAVFFDPCGLSIF